MYLLSHLMNRFIQLGTLTIIDVEGKTHVFKGAAGPEVAIRLHDRRLYRSLFFNPELRLGEAYMDGTLTMEKGTIRDFLTLAMLNRRGLRAHPVQSLLKAGLKLTRKLRQRNSAKAAKANVHHHYDLSNELYSLFLDEDMNYSCAYFRTPDDTLEVAQQNKLRHIASKLQLRKGLRVLDIGCGWGGLALYLAATTGVEVLGITLSTEQLALARKRASQRGLDHLVRFEMMDYRDGTETFDRIVSVGMFEHVGLAHFDEYFAQISRQLKPDGVALVHSIGRRGGPGATGAWIRKYIFPGGYSPALSETLASVERAKLWVTDVEILRLHYAKTIRMWEERFQFRRPQIATLMDERFCRMWEFYLTVSELSFSHGGHMNFQLQLTKNVDSLPLTRDYLSIAEQDLDRGQF